MDECKSIVLRKILVMTLIFVLMTVAMPVGAAAGKTYEGVNFPLGDKSFADGVVDFRPGNNNIKDPYDDPKNAIGPPEDDVKGCVALGHGGILTVKFTDNYLIDVDGPDLYVFEFGPAVEPFKVEISKDGSKWIDLGTVSGQPTRLDIHDEVVPGDKFSYVRITDTKSYKSHTPYPGADIDAVGAIGAEEKEPDKAELKISKLYTSKTKYFKDETVKVHYHIKNVGTVDVDEYQMSYKIIDSDGITVYTHTGGKHSIVAGEEQKWHSEKWQITDSAVLGTYTVDAKARWWDASAGKYFYSTSATANFGVIALGQVGPPPVPAPAAATPTPAPTTCGDYGQPCCQPGNICYEGECQNGMCIHCGYWGEPCCEGRTCIDYDSVCEGPGYGICWHPSEDCGHVGYRPCMRDGEPVCYYGVPDRGRNICLACGDYEQPCCQYTGYPCDYGACTVGYPYIGGICKRGVATSTPTIKPKPIPTIKPKPTSRCIFATAAYNTPLHEDIDVLRDFRDEYLMTTPIGSVFVRAYYSTSPPIADVIRENEGLRMIVRQGIVKPSVYISRMFVS